MHLRGKGGYFKEVCIEEHFDRRKA